MAAQPETQRSPSHFELTAKPLKTPFATACPSASRASRAESDAAGVEARSTTGAWNGRDEFRREIRGSQSSASQPGMNSASAENDAGFGGSANAWQVQNAN